MTLSSVQPGLQDLLDKMTWRPPEHPDGRHVVVRGSGDRDYFTLTAAQAASVVLYSTLFLPYRSAAAFSMPVRAWW